MDVSPDQQNTTEAPADSRWWAQPPFSLSLLLTVLVVAAMAFIRLVLVPGRVVPIAYGVPLLLCLWFRDRRLLWGMFASLLIVSWFRSIHGPSDADLSDELRYVHFGLTALNQLLVATVIHVLIGARFALEQRNGALERGNRELAAREAEIAAQNQELQTRARDVEEQSDTLRQTNSQMSGRGRILQSLLELSRSLSAALPRQEVMERVCRTAGGLLGESETAAAILERRGDNFVVACHFGFGPDGLAQTQIPAAHAFASLVLTRGRADYLEQTERRPDLRIPQPARGEPMRSVLAAPLRVSGQTIGTLELYSRTPRVWTEEQMAVVESVAAEASISLETARLFAEIESARRRFEAVFRTLPVCALMAEDPEARVVRGNSAAAAMYGASPDANFTPLPTTEESPLRRQHFRNSKPVELADLPIMRALRGQEVTGEEMEMVVANGRHFQLLVSAAPITDAAGKIAGAVAALADVTPLKKLQEELEGRRREAEESSARKTRFLAAVSHDIRTPANAINLLAELLRRAAGNPKLAPEIPEMANDLQASATSLVNLVSDVLDLTRLDSGGPPSEVSDFTVEDLLTEQQRQMQPLAKVKGLELRFEAPAEPIHLRAPRVKLSRLLGNLTGNAVKFTEMGSVLLGAEVLPDGGLKFWVTDTGLGIPADHLPSVFDEFFQMKNPARDRNTGTGLGLAICKRLVDGMGGQISVQSEVGRGSTFTVKLPPGWVLPVAANADTAIEGTQSAPLLAGVRVLVVEDHNATRSAVSHLLASEGAVVIDAPNGQTALRMLREERPQVILLDMVLPDMDGCEVLRNIRQERPPELRSVLVLTGDVSAERGAEALELGADGLILKPVDLQAVVGFLRDGRAHST